MVVVSHVLPQVLAAKLHDFFSFCGAVTSVTLLGPENGLGRYSVEFELAKAAQTALLLDEAELAGVPIRVAGLTEAAPPEPASSGALTGDILQEEKPKAAILAQLLAKGYVLSDDLIARAVKVDAEKGYSARFRAFVAELEKYVGLDDPNSRASAGYSAAQSTVASWSEREWPNLQFYFDKAALHPRVHSYYQLLQKEVADVHQEANRLYALAKAQDPAPAAAPAPI